MTANGRGSDTSLPDGMEHRPTSTLGNEIGFNVPQSTKSAWGAWHAPGHIGGDGTGKNCSNLMIQEIQKKDDKSGRKK